MAEAWNGGRLRWLGRGRLFGQLGLALLALLLTAWTNLQPACRSLPQSRVLLEDKPAIQRSFATTGHLFNMDGKLRHSDGWVESWLARARAAAEQASGGLAGGESCSVPLIGVVSTLKVRLPVVRSLLQRYPGSQVIVVGDEGSQTLMLPASFRSRVHDLSVLEQNRLYPELSHTLPLRSFSRKNVGYVHAVALGACYIWDFDDDNFADVGDGVAVLDMVVNGSKPTTSNLLGSILAPNSSVVNPYFMFGPNLFVYPRGYPRQAISSGAAPALFSIAARNLSGWEIDVVQVVQNISADVDADWRINNPGPLVWQPPVALRSGGALVAIDPASLAPYNAQATLISRRAVFSMYLPFTVHGRVSDIWRSYFAQGVLPAMAGLVAFAAPAVDHRRNPHSDLADFDAEIPLYTRGQAFVEFIRAWRSSATLTGDLGVGLVQVYAQAATQGLFDEAAEEELSGLLTYLDTLRKLSYTMPRAEAPAPAVPVVPHIQPFTNVLAVVHINFGHFTGIPLWQAMNPELPKTVFYLPGTSPCPSVSGLDIVCLSTDVGGYYAYESAFHAYQAKPGFDFYMFSHDDAAVRPASLRCMVDSNSSYRSQDMPLSSETASQWHWYNMINDTISGMKAKFEFEKRDTQRREFAQRLQPPPCAAGPDAWFYQPGSGDWFLATRQDMGAMLGAAEVYRREGLFLEVAVPTLFRCYAPSARVVRMLQLWDQRRYGNYDPHAFRQEFCNSSWYDVVHPLKLTSADWSLQHLLGRECPFAGKPTSACLDGKFTF